MIFDPKHKILTYNEAEQQAERLKKQGQKIVMMSGTFDLTHITHVGFFHNAKKNGEVLFIALGTDEHIRTLKGPTRPIMTHDIRASMLAALEIVDYIVIADEPLQIDSKIHFEKLLSKIKPDVFAINDDDSAIEEKRKFISKKGIRFVTVPRFLLYFGDESTDYINTTNIIKRIKNSG